MKMSLFVLVVSLMVLTTAGGQTGAAGNGRAWRLRNRYFDVRGEGPVIEFLALDPSGHGALDDSGVRRILFDGVRSSDAMRLHLGRNEVHILGCRSVASWTIANQKANFAARLEPGHTLGQTFTVKNATFSSVSVFLPTWHTSDSSVTLTLRKDGPGGEMIASRRLENVPDNSWQTLTFERQPAGSYYIELNDPKGSIGWWSIDRDVIGGGEAFADDEAVEGWDRAIMVPCERTVGAADFVVRLRGKTLHFELTERPASGEAPRSRPLQWVTYWTNRGYDVSKEAVPFSRFFTDNQRYMPVEQLKRSRIGGHLTFSNAQWIEAEGTDDYDLRFSANPISLAWSMTEDELTLSLGAGATEREPGVRMSALAVTVLPRRDTLPADWPRFDTPDRELTNDLNRFFRERTFTYPAPSGTAPWFEWSALVRFWFAGPLREGERRGVEEAVIDDEGYVYTWRSNRGWPFPDNTKYDTRHFDTNARYILAVWRYVCWTHDMGFLRSQAERVRRAMNYQLTTLQGREGLIITVSKDITGKHGACGNNYWDILPFGHLDAYANIVYYASLLAMAEIEELIEEAGGIKTDSPGRSPATYRRLAERTREAYNATFWDEDKGRYIGCIDIDGERHDYGFTFVNLEAMAYGLADRKQAQRIYRWMETEPTSTGKADVYSAWIFAPRATTIHNPKWGRGEGWDDLPGPVKPWWHFGWHGTDFGEQCQDGGAILYTSFYDLMARTKFLGAENAWRRWTEILGRYRLPDRLCGGAPLYRGEIPQRINPAWVGVDIPFPESGLVPTWFLYGVMGVEARADGLHIHPHLPAELPWLAVRNVSYRGLTLDIRVTPTSVRLISRTPGYRFVWEKEFDEGQGVVFRQPPPTVPGFPEVATQTRCNAEWIWASSQPSPNETVYLRFSLELPAKPSRSYLDVAADNKFVLFVNGKEVQTGTGWKEATRIRIGRFLHKGRNVIAIEATNEDGPAGVLVTGRITSGGKLIEINSNRRWRVAEQAPPDWSAPEFDDSAWKPATSLGRPPVAPWGQIQLP